jgi:hypothetical protein
MRRTKTLEDTRFSHFITPLVLNPTVEQAREMVSPYNDAIRKGQMDSISPGLIADVHTMKHLLKFKRSFMQK